jgi:uncharacterized protein YjbI with pentapeptide repeats
LQVIAWVTLVIAPVSLLLLIQIEFLPYHSTRITWSHRIWLLADLGLIWLLWRRVLSGWESRISLAWTVAGAALTGCALLFSLLVVTFPGEAGVPVSLHDWVYRSLVDDSIPRSRSFLSDTLVLSGSNIYESLGIDDPEKAKWRDYTFSARNRNLRGALFNFASLPNVDFTGADLQDASFTQAQLQMASLDRAKLQGARLSGAHLQGASLDAAQLQGASLDAAQLQGAKLGFAHLQGASLDFAELQGADLQDVQLQGASLVAANLQGASLKLAWLQGARLRDAQLQGALLENVRLQAGDLSESHTLANQPRHTYTLGNFSNQISRLEQSVGTALLEGYR